MIVSNRIKAVAEMVTPCGVVADIGCDHCLTLIYLINNSKCKKGIGCDVKTGPLEKAEENLSRFGFSHKIRLRLGGGLAPLCEDEIETVIISGMGGHLINQILSEYPEKTRRIKELIVQPQLDSDAVRKYLHLCGFKIVSEKMVMEQEKFYTIIKAQKGSEKYISETDYLFGKVLIDSKDSVLKQFLENSLERNTKILSRLSKQSTENSVNKTNEIKNENSLIKEVLACL